MNSTRGIILCTIFLAALCIPYCTASDVAVIGMNGTCFSPYNDGQRPPDPISPLQIEERLVNISHYTQWIRTFGCTNGLENTGKIAHNMGLKTAIGAWIDDNLTVNEWEIKNLIKVANEGDVNIAVVGNERILTNTSPDLNPRKLINKTQLIDYITRVKQNTGIYVTTAEPWHIWRDNPDLIDAVDVIFVNIYPYHEGQPIDNAIQFTEEKYNLVRNLAGNKPVIISEMGWPSAGNANGAAIPSMENATYYFINITKWAKDNNIQYFYFEAFDEQWKSYDDQWVYHPDWAYQSHWGIWNSNGTKKLPVTTLPVAAFTAIGVYKNGVWYLDINGNGTWDGDTDKAYSFGAPGWTPNVGDWNATGNSYIGVTNGQQWYLDWNGNGAWDSGVDKAYSFGATGWSPIVGDWNNDGKTDIGVTNGQQWYLDMNNNGVWDGSDKAYTFGATGWTPIVGDWNHDGTTDIGVTNGQSWYLDMNNNGAWDAGTDKAYTFGAPGWTPIVGDWNHDGTTDIGVMNGQSWYLDMNNNGVFDSGVDKAYSFGAPGWTPIVGNWNGDATGTKIGVTNGQQWYLDSNGNGVWDAGTDKAYSFGATGWTPIVYWNNDGKNDIGVTNGQQWYLDSNGNGAWDNGVDYSYSFGASRWTPVVGKWS